MTCAPLAIGLWNRGNVATTVEPPTLEDEIADGIATDFDAPHTIEPGETYTFHVSAVSNPQNGCATAGTLKFLDLQNNCSSRELTQRGHYSGACNCDGI